MEELKEATSAWQTGVMEAMAEAAGGQEDRATLSACLGHIFAGKQVLRGPMDLKMRSIVYGPDDMSS